MNGCYNVWSWPGLPRLSAFAGDRGLCTDVHSHNIQARLVARQATCSNVIPTTRLQDPLQNRVAGRMLRTAAVALHNMRPIHHPAAGGACGPASLLPWLLQASNRATGRSGNTFMTTCQPLFSDADRCCCETDRCLRRPAPCGRRGRVRLGLAFMICRLWLPCCSLDSTRSESH